MNEQPPSKDLLLKPCPFCGGTARWCADAEHECHLIVCGDCKISIDFQENPDTETVHELRIIMADKWNRRAEIDRLNADLAFIRRRTGFWGEVPQEPPFPYQQNPIGSGAISTPPPLGDASPALDYADAIAQRRAAQPPCPAPADTLTELADWLTAHSHTQWATQFGHGPHMRKWAAFLREIKR